MIIDNVAGYGPQGPCKTDLKLADVQRVSRLPVVAPLRTFSRLAKPLFVLVKLIDNVLTAKQAAKRRLISLIYAGWVPHDKGSSWSYLSLGSRVIPLPGAS